MTAGLKRIPRSVQLAAALSGVLTLTLTGAVGSALRTPGALGLPLTRLEALDYARDAPVSFTPVGLGLIEEIIGPGSLFDFGSGPEGVIAAGGDGVVPVGPGPGGVSPPQQEDTDNEAGPIDPSDPPRGELEPPITLPDAPVLTLTFTADRSHAARGETVTYSIRVQNDGNAAASSVRVDTHTPAGTTFQGQENCQGNTITALPGDGSAACVDADDVLPPPDYQPDEHLGKTMGKLFPGEHESFVFTVKVDDTTSSGTKLRNHVHVSAVNHDSFTSATLTVTVT